MKILIVVVLLLSGASVSGALRIVDLALGKPEAVPAAGSVAQTHPGALRAVDLELGKPDAPYAGGVASAHAGALRVGDFAFGASGAVRAGNPGAVKSIWEWPLVGPGGSPPTVARPFDPPVHRWLAGHRGVDLVAPSATEVLAAGPGTVAFAGTLFGQGIVVVSHGAVRTSYEPVSPAATLHVGDSVVAGTPLGTLNPGHCRGSPCLHWGLLTGHGHGVQYYDPLLLLGLVHLRLEPVGQVGGAAAGSG